MEILWRATVASGGPIDSRAAKSLVVEWFWAAYPGVSELGERASRLFADGVPGLPELLLLAARAGVLEVEDPEAALAAIASAAGEPTVELRLATEPAARREVIARRLAGLAAGPQLRREYLELVRALAGYVRERVGEIRQKSVELAVAELGETLRGGSVVAALGLADEARAALVRMLSSLEIEAPLLVVPAVLAEGVVVLDLGSTLLVGIPARRGVRLGAAGAQQLARRARALGDPTRLSILDALAQGSAPIGALAARFGLAQPTVSNHVRVLREAGLVTGSDPGTRRSLELVPGGLDELLAELATLASTHANDEVGA